MAAATGTVLPGRPVSLSWPASLLFLGAVYGAALAAVNYSPSWSLVAVWWPAAGLAVGLLTLTSPGRWPVLGFGIVAASTAALVSVGQDLETATLFGLTHVVEAVAAALVLRGRPGRVPRLDTLETLLRLVVASVVGALVAGAGAAAVVTWVGDGSIATTLRAVLPSHAAAVLILVPAALGLARRGRPHLSVELVVQAAALAAVIALTFGPDQELSLAFALFPVLAWGAVRLDSRLVTWELALTSIAIVYVTARGWGPLAPEALSPGGGGRQLSAALVQGYLLAVALVALPLMVAVAQRHALLARVTADERLFRRNFTESLTGMLFLEGTEPEPFGGRAGRRLDLTVVDANHTAVGVLGEDREQLEGRDLAALVDSVEDLGRVAARILAGDGDGWNAQVSLRGARPGRVILGLSLLSRGPGPPIFSAQLIDVTAEYDARRRSEASEKLTNATLDTAACIILLTDLEGRLLRVNAATAQITGYPEREMTGRAVWDTTFAPGTAAEVHAMLIWPNRGTGPAVQERDAVTRDGRKLRISWNHSLVNDEAGRPAYAVFTGIDVTSERRFAGLVDHLLRASTSTAVVGVDHDGLVSVFNSGAAHLLGLDEQEVVGRPFHELLDLRELTSRTGTPDPDLAFEQLVRDIDHGGETEASDWSWVDAHGAPHIVSMTISAPDDHLAAESGFLVVGHDVTAQRRGEDMLVAALDKERTAVERLRSLDAAKDEFVSTVSHELRTPVTSILGYTELLKDGSIVEPLPDQKPLLDTITRNSHRLIEVCNDLLVLSELDAGTRHWTVAPVDLAACVDRVEEAVRPLVADRKLDLELRRPMSPVMVQGDRAQLERVVLNLLSNGVKFTEDGGTVRCSLSEDDGYAVLTVSDTGMGIPLEEQDGLFQKFFRTSAAHERAIQGTGLGLSIVAAVVKGHDGRISVDSAAGEGATFTVRLPLLG